MFRQRNRRQGFRENNSRTPLLLKRREISQKKKPIEVPPSIDSQQKIQEEKMMFEARLSAWEKYEIIGTRSLHKQDRAIRHQFLTFLLFEIQPIYGLKLRTIEHAIKMLDIYEGKREIPTMTKQSKSIRKLTLYPQRHMVLIDLITCLFLSTKYNDIYPPSLYEIIESLYPLCKNEMIIKNEILVLEALEMNLNVALASDWFKLINKTLMPNWAYLCYLDFDLKDQSKTIADQINMYIENILQSKEPQFYELAKLHLKCKKQKRLSQEDSFKLYNGFKEFRVNKRLGKMTLESESKQADSKSSRTISIKSKQTNCRDL